MKLEWRLKFFARRRCTPRRIIALVAGFSVVFQALLFAWHEHELPFASQSASAVAVAAAGSEAPALGDDDCPICSAIAHHGAVPIDLFVPPTPDLRPLPSVPRPAVGISRASYLLFRSRAPPRA